VSKIAVIGTGYVGLTTAVGLAELGHEVAAFDINPEKITSLSLGKSPIFEPGLEEILGNVLKTKNLLVTDDLAFAVSEAEFIFTCVPTPQDEDGSADLSFVIAASQAIGPLLKSNSIVITKSTVPVGAAAQVEKALNRKDIHVASNPEFLREGAAVQDFKSPDRIVVGARNTEIGNRVLALYSRINCPKIITSQSAAELIKYASNSFLAMKLSFVNDMAALCEAVEANPIDVMHGMGLDSRIGNKFLEPGPGWGGSCFPKDTRALGAIAEEHGIQIPLIAAAIASNETAHKRVADRVMHALGGSLVGAKIAVLGITFKANTDDTRDSPAIAVIDRLIGRGAQVKAFDPMVKAYSLSGLELCDSVEQAIVNADALIVLTEWPEFRNIDPIASLKVMKQQIVIDTRNIIDRSAWESAGAIFPKLKA
jgi:UDPglucose 6-dehydrogenase